MNTDKQAIKDYRDAVKRLKVEMDNALKPFKAELGYYFKSQRNEGRTVSNILNGMGINNRNLAYECMDLAELHTPAEISLDLPLDEIIEVTKSDDTITFTPVRPILPGEWTFPNAQVKEPYSETLVLENVEPYLPLDFSQSMSPLRAEILQGSLKHLLA